MAEARCYAAGLEDKGTITQGMASRTVSGYIAFVFNSQVGGHF